jgi:hypothetical protein
MLVAWFILYRTWNRGSGEGFSVGIFFFSGLAAFVGVGMVWMLLSDLASLASSSSSNYPEDRYGR